MIKKSFKKHNKKEPRHKKEDVLESDLDNTAVDESLRSIYEIGEGEMPDMTKLEKTESKRWIWIMAIISAAVLFLVALAWAGVYFFKTYQGFSGKGLELSIEGPEKISLGEETTYFINYRNPLHEPLASAEVRINFPADFMITHANPSLRQEGNVWTLGALAAEEQGTITIRGKFTGALGTISAVQAIATYRPANYSSDFEAMATKQIEYADTVMEGWIQTPEKAVPGDNTSLIYHIKNTGSEALTKLQVRIKVPEGFAIDMKSIDTTQVEGRIFTKNIPGLSAGSSTEVAIVGTFATGYGGDAEVSAEAGTLGADGEFLPMQKAEAVFPVLAGDLSLTMVVNGSNQAKRGLAYGEILHGIIGYENTADEALKDITIKIKMETIDSNSGEVLTNVTLVDEGGISSSATTTKTEGAMIWSRDSLADLGELSAHGGGDIDINIPLVKAAPTKGAVAMKLSLEAEIKAVGDTELNRTIHMEPMIFVMKSDARLSAEARYYSEEGAPYGEGPLPPIVGQSTKYRIIWTIDKTVHGISDIDVSADLPRSVTFVTVATTSAGTVEYNAEDRQVHWKLNRMPQEVNQAEAWFDVSITPQPADDGRFATLLEEVTLQANDDDTKEQLLQVIKRISTDLQNDEKASGKGVVRKN
ncbi:MAG: hypothetical protein ACOYUZ_00620 [Patescibacteria group bacterium]